MSDEEKILIEPATEKVKTQNVQCYHLISISISKINYFVNNQSSIKVAKQ